MTSSEAIAPLWDGLGLKTEGIISTEFEHGAVVFFDREGGLKLAPFPRWRKKSLSC
jgi:hypothetical protein